MKATATERVIAAGGEPITLDPNRSYRMVQICAQFFQPEAPAYAPRNLLTGDDDLVFERVSQSR